MLTSYRRYCARNSSESQLILPDSLKLLPVYLCGLLKNVFLNNLPTSRPVRSFVVYSDINNCLTRLVDL